MRIKFYDFINSGIWYLFYICINLILLLYTFLGTSFAQQREQETIFLISFSKFSGILLAFTCATAIGNL